MDASKDRFRAKKVLSLDTFALLIPLAGTADSADAITVKNLFVEAQAQLIRSLGQGGRTEV
eukprot:1366518-Amphidinium_carterae.1